MSQEIIEVEEPPISISEAIRWQLRHSGMFAEAGLLALQNLTDGAVIAALGSDAVAASPITAGLFATTLGFARGALPVEQWIQADIAAGHPERVGPRVWHGWVVAASYGAPITGLFYFAESAARLVGIASHLALQIGAYCRPFSFAVMPLCFLSVDSRALLGLQHTQLLFACSALYSVASMGLGYPFALGWLGNTPGFAGMAWGSVVGVYFNVIAVRSAMAMLPSLQQYRFFHFSLAGACEQTRQLYRTGMPYGLLKVGDWANLALIAWALALYDSEVALPAFAPSSYLILINTFLFSQTFGPIAAIYGAARQGQRAVPVAMQNVRRATATASCLNGILMAIAGAGLLIFSKSVCEFFLDDSARQNKAIVSLARRLLITNVVATLLEACRSVYSPGLQGMQDSVFAPVVSFVMMTVVGLTVGGGLMELSGAPDSLFIVRDVTLALASAAIAWRFYRQTQPAQTARLLPAPADNHQPENPYGFFTALPCCIGGTPRPSPTPI